MYRDALAAAGIVAGTDTPDPFCLPGFGVHDELQLFVQAGLTPKEALPAATHNAAQFNDALDPLGTVEQGNEHKRTCPGASIWT